MTRQPQDASMVAVQHTARLPYGYEVTFIGTADGMRVEWSPTVPRITSRRAWRKFYAAYRRARDEFLGELATLLGGSVGVADFDDIGSIKVIEPATRH